MRIVGVLCCLAFLGCATARQQSTDTSGLKDHPPPYIIFGIGYLPPHNMVDDHRCEAQYITITVGRKDGFMIFKRGEFDMPWCHWGERTGHLCGIGPCDERLIYFPGRLMLSRTDICNMPVVIVVIRPH
jgi:hypothetical protein